MAQVRAGTNESLIAEDLAKGALSKLGAPDHNLTGLPRDEE